jgi:hypothetical protein
MSEPKSSRTKGKTRKIQQKNLLQNGEYCSLKKDAMEAKRAFLLLLCSDKRRVAV